MGEIRQAFEAAVRDRRDARAWELFIMLMQRHEYTTEQAITAAYRLVEEFRRVGSEVHKQWLESK